MTERTGLALDETRLAGCLESLATAGIGDATAEQLGTFIRAATDPELFRVNPLRYGAANDLGETESIDLFLQATRAGLFQMEWNIVCVSCGNVFKSFRHLEKVDRHFHCTLCDMENESRLDDVIQVAFTVDSSVREIIFHHPDDLTAEQLLFGFQYSRTGGTRVGDTATADFLRDATVALRYLEPDEAIEVEVDLDNGTLLVRDWSTSFAFFVRPDLEKSTKSYLLLIGEEGLEHPDIASSAVPIETPVGTILLPAVHLIGPTLIELTCRNDSGQRRPIWIVRYPPTFTGDVLDSIEWSNPLTAKRILHSATFRHLFRSEAPGEDEGLTVADLTFLFTDLKSSTSMYDEIGDVTAYNLVRGHFDMISGIVAKHDGIVVKTIGDAVMATFLTPVDAVKAAFDLIREVGTVSTGSADKLALKVGVHRGHSIAVNLNERLDYFGQNVNIAARTQQLAEANEVLITQDVADADGVATLLSQGRVETVSGAMNGIAEEIPVLRVTVQV